MDPLAELVKIDPKSIGVGQYQHDVHQPRLREALDREVEVHTHRERIGLLLDMTMRDMERVLYYEAYVMIDPGPTDMKERELIGEERYRELRAEFGDSFLAMMGGEGVKELLKRIDVATLDQAALENGFFCPRHRGLLGRSPLELQLQWRVSFGLDYRGVEALRAQREAGVDNVPAGDTLQLNSSTVSENDWRHTATACAPMAPCACLT